MVRLWRSFAGLSALLWLVGVAPTGVASPTSDPTADPHHQVQAPPSSLKVLFLGDDGPHQPADKFRRIAPLWKQRGIHADYVDTADALHPETLARYDVLAIYSNLTHIEPDQEAALLDFVAQGKGLLAIHCASFCFHNSDAYIRLVGAQFQRHGLDYFGTELRHDHDPAAPAQGDHDHGPAPKPEFELEFQWLTRGFHGFKSWDETYVHHRHDEANRVVVEWRADDTVPGGREPWSWIKRHGKGRVFYTAWGHDERTWSHPGFHAWLERGLLWAAGREEALRDLPAYADSPTMIDPATLPAVQLARIPAKVPFYPPGRQWGVTAEPFNSMQAPLRAEESRQRLVHPADLTPELFASDPLITGKPIWLTWDIRGRAWIAETIDYPNERNPNGPGRDRVVILEDTNGDGVADRRRVFAEGLSIPTSFVFHRDGIVVVQAPQTLWLRDTDGDDVADRRDVLFEGWSPADTHAGPNNLRRGLDGWIYGMMGYAGFQGVVGGERYDVRTGFFRYHPDLNRFEFLRNTTNNSWGVGFSEEGILFGSTANGNPSEYLPIPNRYYERVRGWSSTVLQGIGGNAPMFPITDQVRQVDHHGHFTAAAGHALYTARRYDPRYWNRTAFVTEGTGHLVATFEIDPDGAGFHARNAFNLLASDDEWTAPVIAEVGPDGCVWVVDWYNYIFQHNPTPAGYETGPGNAYETELRDKTRGRIYRLVPTPETDRQPQPVAPDLTGADPARWVAALTHDNLFWRTHAQRLLAERGQTDVVPRLVALTNDRTTDAIGLNVGAIHALWTLHELGALADPNGPAFQAAVGALSHPSAGVRRNAALVLAAQPAPPSGDDPVTSALLSAKLIEDESAQVRLAALLALADRPASISAGRALAAIADRPENALDRWIPDALTAAAAIHAQGFLPALIDARAVTAQDHSNGPTATPATLVRNARQRSGDVAAIVAGHLARNADLATLETMLPSLTRAQPDLVDRLIGAFAEGWPQPRGNAPANLKLSPEAEAALLSLFDRVAPASKGRLALLARNLGSERVETKLNEAAAELLATFRDEEASETARAEAVARLIEFRGHDDATLRQIVETLGARTPPDLLRDTFRALASAEAPGLGVAVIERLPALPPSARQAAFQTLIARASSSAALLDALEAGNLAPSDLALDQRVALTNHPDPTLARRARSLLERAGGLPSADRQHVIEEWLDLTRQVGDANHGKAVFAQHCLKCHRHSALPGGEGIGPDLTGMAAHPKSELLVHILDPSRDVEGNFKVYTVVTDDGLVLSGLLASETKTSLELIDADGRKHLIERAQVEELRASEKSLMPEGFESQMSRSDLNDLLEFLTLKGRYVPLPLDKVATVTSVKGMFYNEEARSETLDFGDWSPKTIDEVPFVLVDPQGGARANVVLLHSPNGAIPPRMPRVVRLPYDGPARAIHLLGGVGGWAHPYGREGAASLIVRLVYRDGQTEDHPLRNGVHLADYIRRVDVPGSRHAFDLKGRQVRFLSIKPARPDQPLAAIEFRKGRDEVAPLVLAVTVETP
ncbi:membrane-bound dehydrogenase domain protein [Isosphaera pallida ATCC 43644]|uniref:Membrane-bound dehydrogenase domain protein n=1 Tax=Isosphaera pallida (strain ATCC 43644 / DSM 9630 / IS1B) TaxID=575540 RepID=E8QWQ7_ISOPI|nr:PVC-type heme-binding CxxCH protein [Isosphaera pallida]ADV62957.1 membrane-bound dehydrogenase domain protein [Isosphaera pallida ATCC 43644]